MIAGLPLVAVLLTLFPGITLPCGPTRPGGEQGGRVLRLLNPPGREDTDPPFTTPYLQVRVSPDGRQAVYTTDQASPGVFDLYSVRLDGTAPAVRLNDPLAPGQDVRSFSISPDSSLVVYLVYEAQTAATLYRVPIGGGLPAPVDGPIPLGHVGTGFSPQEFTPDSTRLVYRADRDDDGAGLWEELLVAPLDGGPPRLLGGPLAQGFFGAPKLTPDASHAVCGTSSPYQLLAFALDGSAPVLLDTLADAPGFLVAPDSARVVYSSNHAPATRRELFSAPLDGSAAPVRLSGGAEVRIPDFAVAPGVAVYLADEDTSGVDELYAVDLLGTVRIRLNQDLVAGGAVQADWGLGAGSQQVLFRADAGTDNRFLLYRVPVTGGPVQIVNGPLVAGGDVTGFAIAPDGSHIVYRADQELNQLFELYAASFAGGDPVRLDSQGRTEFLQLGPNARWFLTHDDPLEPFTPVGRAFRVPFDGSPAAALNPAPCPRFFHDDPLFVGPSRVLFVGGDTPEDRDLYLSAPLPGQAAPASAPGLPALHWPR